RENASRWAPGKRARGPGGDDGETITCPSVEGCTACGWSVTRVWEAQHASPAGTNAVDTSSPSQRCPVTRENEHQTRPLSRRGRGMQAAPAPAGRVLAPRAALPPPRAVVRHGVVQEAHCWGPWPCPLYLSMEHTAPPPVSRYRRLFWRVTGGLCSAERLPQH